MKATVYMNKYGPAFALLSTDEERLKMISEIADGFYAELKEMMKVRHISTNKGLYHAVNELNAKWNALARLFEKHLGCSPLRRDGFRNLIDLALKKKGEAYEQQKPSESE